MLEGPTKLLQQLFVRATLAVASVAFTGCDSTTPADVNAQRNAAQGERSSAATSAELEDSVDAPNGSTVEPRVDSPEGVASEETVILPQRGQAVEAQPSRSGTGLTKENNDAALRPESQIREPIERSDSLE